MDTINTYRWTFGHGKDKEIKEIIIVKSDLFSHPTILTSDLHTYGLRVIESLDMFVNLQKFIVISVGDM